MNRSKFKKGNVVMYFPEGILGTVQAVGLNKGCVCYRIKGKKSLHGWVTEQNVYTPEEGEIRLLGS